MRRRETPENEAIRQALIGWSALVLVPGMLFVFGLIYLVMPPYKPPPQNWANGTYTNPCCAPLVLRDGVLATGDSATHYVVSDDKSGHQIEVATGIGVRSGKVEFGGTLAFVHFNDPPRYVRGAAKSLHLYGLDDYRAYTFVRQE